MIGGARYLGSQAFDAPLLVAHTQREDPGLVAPEGWTERALCATLSPAQADKVFFGGSSFSNTDAHHLRRQAARLCGPCPVKAQCLEAGRHETYGVWGGLTPPERRAHFGLLSDHDRGNQHSEAS